MPFIPLNGGIKRVLMDRKLRLGVRDKAMLSNYVGGVHIIVNTG
jgi:hypothetical protein